MPMKTVVLFPTVEEGKEFILGEPPVATFVSGVGAAETAAAVVRAVRAKKPDLVLLAGIAGAYDRTIPVGTVFEVTSERTAALPARYRAEYTVPPVTDLPEAASNTSDRMGTEAEGARLENMEGAALFAACAALGVRCCEIRAVANYVGDPFEQWDIPCAVTNLTETLRDLFADAE